MDIASLIIGCASLVISVISLILMIYIWKATRKEDTSNKKDIIKEIKKRFPRKLWKQIIDNLDQIQEHLNDETRKRQHE